MLQDLKSSAYSNLALTLMTKFSEEEDEVFKSFVFKNGGSGVGGGGAGVGCPFASCSIGVVELICQVLRVKVIEARDNYLPCLFAAPIDEDPFLWVSHYSSCVCCAYF